VQIAELVAAQDQQGGATPLEPPAAGREHTGARQLAPSGQAGR